MCSAMPGIEAAVLEGRHLVHELLHVDAVAAVVAAGCPLQDDRRRLFTVPTGPLAAAAAAAALALLRRRGAAGVAGVCRCQGDPCQPLSFRGCPGGRLQILRKLQAPGLYGPEALLVAALDSAELADVDLVMLHEDSM